MNFGITKRGAEWSFSTAIFLRVRAGIKKFALRPASSFIESIQLASSEHFLYFPLAAIHMEILFFKIKHKIF